MGASRAGPIRNSMQYQASKVHLEVSSSPGGGSRRSLGTLGIQSSLCLPSMASHCKTHVEDHGRNHSGNSSSTILTEASLVPHSDVPEYPASSQNCADTFPPVSEVSHPSRSRQVEPSHLAAEGQRFESLGCFNKVITTLLRARKLSTNSVYDKVWN